MFTRILRAYSHLPSVMSYASCGLFKHTVKAFNLSIQRWVKRIPLVLLPSTTKLRRLCFYTCLSVHRGVCLSACWDTTPPGAGTPMEQIPPGTKHPLSRHSPGTRHPLGPDPPRTRHTPGSRHPPRAGTPRTRHLPPADGYCCGRYASYWNAFSFTHNMKKIKDATNKNADFTGTCERALKYNAHQITTDRHRRSV